MRERLISRTKAARYLGLGVQTFDKAVVEEGIPVYRFRNRRVFRREDLDRVIENLPVYSNGETSDEKEL